MILHTLVFLCFFINDDVVGKSARIIGGDDANIIDFPFMASLRMVPENLHFCGCVIISQFHFLSAAHCFFKREHLYSSMRIYTGTSSSTSVTEGPHFMIDRVFIHPEYTGLKTLISVNQHDISVLKVNETIIFNEFQNKVSLPTSNVNGGEIGLLIGWGSTEFPNENIAPILQEVPMIILSNPLCQIHFLFNVLESHICAYINRNRGVCTGDSGGPLIRDNEIVGIVSMSEPCATGIPDMYTRVYSYLNFITEIMTK